MTTSRDDLVQDPDSSSILIDAPEELLLIIAKHIQAKPDAEKIPMFEALSLTCRTTHCIFKPEFKKPAAKKLLELVLMGKKAEALKMIAADPILLFIQTEAQDYAISFKGKRRTIKASPYRAMQGAGDTDMLLAVQPYIDQIGAKEIDMLLKVQPLIARQYTDKGVSNGRQLALAQINEQFPNGIENNPSTYDFSALVTAITAEHFVNGQISAATEEALANFRFDFEPVVVENGKHFDLQVIVRALEVLAANYNAWQLADEWSDKKCSLFWCKVIGYLQRMAPACDGQAFRQGLYYFLEKRLPSGAKVPLERNLELDTPGGKVNFYPMAAAPAAGLGDSYGAYMYWAAWGPSAAFGRAERPGLASRVENLCRAKTSGLEEVKQQLQRPADLAVLGQRLP